LLVSACVEETQARSGESQVNDTLTKTGIIAIVDDDEPLRDALESVLKAAGFSPTTYASAEEFLASADWPNTACLILDVRLPGMSGIELQRHLAEAHSGIPIIFVTAHGDASLRELVMKAGASGFLNKPVRSEALLTEIYAALERSRTDK
jgi:FixJ family two-component response regulator